MRGKKAIPMSEVNIPMFYRKSRNYSGKFLNISQGIFSLTVTVSN